DCTTARARRKAAGPQCVWPRSCLGFDELRYPCAVHYGMGRTAIQDCAFADARTIERFTTMSTAAQAPMGGTANCAGASSGLALVRVTIGAMFVWVLFESLGKGLSTAAGYAGLIRHYIEASHSPAIWKAVMAIAANQARMAAPMQGFTEI